MQFSILLAVLTTSILAGQSEVYSPLLSRSRLPFSNEERTSSARFDSVEDCSSDILYRSFDDSVLHLKGAKLNPGNCSIKNSADLDPELVNVTPIPTRTSCHGLDSISFNIVYQVPEATGQNPYFFSGGMAKSKSSRRRRQVIPSKGGSSALIIVGGRASRDFQPDRKLLATPVCEQTRLNLFNERTQIHAQEFLEPTPTVAISAAAYDNFSFREQPSKEQFDPLLQLYESDDDGATIIIDRDSVILLKVGDLISILMNAFPSKQLAPFLELLVTKAIFFLDEISTSMTAARLSISDIGLIEYARFSLSGIFYSHPFLLLLSTLSLVMCRL
ncbi:uncharacterized protein V1516DRAFT_684636 [Lipomyces oligophaga]|uniref:uncharacterized protein n=1 Tax=Lipomyces oligophaga TaxID=45792 RepID=UPI0034CE7885